MEHNLGSIYFDLFINLEITLNFVSNKIGITVKQLI